MTDTPKIAQKALFAVEAEAGRSYFRCARRHSGKQPFCDGTHKSL